MALQSLLNDPNISTFLQKIPQNQQIITLKQLIYIGIKIVSDSFNKQDNNLKSSAYNKKIQFLQDKQNSRFNQQRFQQKPQFQQNKAKKSNKNKKKYSFNENNKQNHSSNNRKTSNLQNPHLIESTLLRQISKIRMQLESLTNKVYDHCFEQFNNPNQDQSQPENYQSKNHPQQDYFNYGQDMLTFSPQKNNKQFKSRKNQDKVSLNAFRKLKNNFFDSNSNQNRNYQNAKPSKGSKDNKQTNFQSRNRAKSNIMHMDDTQIRQALYKQDSEPQNNSSQNFRNKKSQSLIQKKHQQKKKDQQNYFYNLAVDKQRVQQLQKIKKSKIQHNPPQRDIQDLRNGKSTSQLNLYKKKVKSKIKKLVERDRLRYQQKLDQYNFKKGFEQYQYSANQLEDEKSQSEEDDNQIQHHQSLKKKQKQYEKQQDHSQRVQYSQERQQSNPNFGFYSNAQNSTPQENTFSNNQNFQEQDNINICSNSSSFSQFSMSGSSKREVGKISRRKPE